MQAVPTNSDVTENAMLSMSESISYCSTANAMFPGLDVRRQQIKHHVDYTLQDIAKMSIYYVKVKVNGVQQQLATSLAATGTRIT